MFKRKYSAPELEEMVNKIARGEDNDDEFEHLGNEFSSDDDSESDIQPATMDIEDESESEDQIGGHSSSEEEEILDPDPAVEHWKTWEEGEQRFPDLPFTQNVGFHPPRNSPLNNELDFFQLFFTDAILQAIVDETNR